MSTMVSFRLSETVLDAIDRAAGRNGQSRSEFILSVLDESLQGELLRPFTRSYGVLTDVWELVDALWQARVISGETGRELVRSLQSARDEVWQKIEPVWKAADSASGEERKGKGPLPKSAAERALDKLYDRDFDGIEAIHDLTVLVDRRLGRRRLHTRGQAPSP